MMTPEENADLYLSGTSRDKEETKLYRKMIHGDNLCDRCTEAGTRLVRTPWGKSEWLCDLHARQNLGQWAQQSNGLD